MAKSCQSGAAEPGMGVDRRSGVRDCNHSHRLPLSSDTTTMQSELESAKQATDQAKVQATEFAKRFASLNSELEKVNAQRNELQTKFDQATFGDPDQPIPA